MNTNFTKVGIGRARNDNGVIVRSYDKESIIYENGSFSLPIEMDFVEDYAIIYKPAQSVSRPPGLSRDDLLAEIMAGAQIVARRDVRWRD